MVADSGLAVVVDRPSLQTSRISPLILAHNGSALTWFDNTNDATFYPHLMVVLAYPTVCTAMHLRMLRYPIRLYATVPPAYRIGLRERRRGETV